jgi:hypothetical protein
LCTSEHFIKKNPTRCNTVSEILLFQFIWSSTCTEWHTAHHQEPKTALCVVGGVRHLQHTQINSNSSRIAADNNTVQRLPDAVVTVVLCSWRWVMVTPETCRAVIR